MRLHTAVLGAFLICLVSCAGDSGEDAKDATGVVFNDTNRNGKRDAGEPGVAGALVSNQTDVVETDGEGRYRLSVKEGDVVFLIKPGAYSIPLDRDNLPRFFYIHQPDGSPATKYAGVSPTGPLPESIDFPLYKTGETGAFDVIVFSDPQPRSDAEIDYIRDDVVGELVDSKAAFGITLGDIMYNDLSLFDRYNRVVSQIGVPFYNVPGNHDMNFDSPDDRDALETFKRHFGPPYYAFEYGRVSFIVLDTVEWLGGGYEKTGHYRGSLGAEQLEWVRRYLRFVPRDRLVVLATHIPLYYAGSDDDHVNVADRDELLELLNDYDRVLVVAGHMHLIEQDDFDRAIGWRGNGRFQQIICSAVSGSWWSGPEDERGIPTTTQRDGSPNGYHVFRFDGNRYTQVHKAAGMDPGYQIRISSPRGTRRRTDVVDTLVVANVFNGNARTAVECRIDEEKWTEMQADRRVDPFMRDLRKRYAEKYERWVEPEPTPHVWTAPLPRDLEAGVHRVAVRIEDEYGNRHSQTAVFEVE